MVSTISSFDSQHEDMIHDVQMDYYGRRIATCSSDKSIRIFEVEGEKLVDVLKGHDGPVWQVSWSHPKFGNLLASSSYDGKVLIWRETNSTWSIWKEHKAHDASVNSISWAPHEYGLILACASSDGKISILSLKNEGQWDTTIIPNAHQIGCNSVSWAPHFSPSLGSNSAAANPVKRLASGGCDNTVKIWRFSEEENTWKNESTLEGHNDWVRDVAWSQNVGIHSSILASCSQDRQVLIWTQETPNGNWTQTKLKEKGFPDVVWRVSWSVTAALLAVSCGDNKVYLFKQSLEGDWESLSELQENDAAGSQQGSR